MHERAWLRDIYSVEVGCVRCPLFVCVCVICLFNGTFNGRLQVKVVCETRDWEHAKELRAALLKKYRDVVFNDTPLALSGETTTTTMGPQQ